MKKEVLNEEFLRMQKLAGIVNEMPIIKNPLLNKRAIEVIKEWIWYTCDEGQATDDINKYNKMVDEYFANKNEVISKEDFHKIWEKVVEKWGVGDVGADWEAFDETWEDVQNGTLMGTY